MGYWINNGVLNDDILEAIKRIEYKIQINSKTYKSSSYSGFYVKNKLFTSEFYRCYSILPKLCEKDNFEVIKIINATSFVFPLYKKRCNLLFTCGNNVIFKFKTYL